MYVGDRVFPVFVAILSIGPLIKRGQLVGTFRPLFWLRSLNQSKLKVCATVLAPVCILYECFCCLFLFFFATFECLMQIDLPASVLPFFFFVSPMPTFCLSEFAKRL